MGKNDAINLFKHLHVAPHMQPLHLNLLLQLLPIHLRMSLEAIRACNDKMSEGKALSDREEAVLQALEILTGGQAEIVWINSAMLREHVAKRLAQPVEKLGDAQWIRNILKRLHLLDDVRRKHGMDGMVYAIQPSEVMAMMWLLFRKPTRNPTRLFV
ncbi:MAG: hypothetical protein ABI690_13230 [Chloroflexota bacterium]